MFVGTNMKTYQVGPKVKGNIKETFNLHLGPSKQRRKSPHTISIQAQNRQRSAQVQSPAHLPKMVARRGRAGAAAPLLPPLEPTFGRVVPSMLPRMVWVVSYFISHQTDFKHV